MTTYPDSREVLTTFGPILGRRLIYEGDKQVDAFQGIPYAKPPIKELRFKKPVAPEPWTNVKETKAFGARCIQIDFPGKEKDSPVSEDCLTLNVFAPVWEPRTDGFAVMVFIHGGGFYTDSCVSYGDVNLCNHLVTKDVVVVTLQYRLGYFGMWSTGDEACPGNNNFWDMTLALKWVKDNIARFNGNPNNITLLGQSAGGAAVDFLSLSPHSRDLFHKVISMGGNASCHWSLSTHNVEKCRAMAEKLGVESWDDSEKFLDDLRQIPAEKFALSLMDITMNDIADEISAPENDLGPRFDGDFFPIHPSELRKEAPSKPRIVGVARSESLLLNLGVRKLSDIYKVASYIFPEAKFSLNFKELRKEYIAKVFPSTGLDKSNNLQREICEAISDYGFVIGTQKNVLDALDHGDEPVYLYRFDHFNPKMYGDVAKYFPYIDATHCSDISYLFGTLIVSPESISEFDEKDFKVIDTMTSLFTNFAKYGNPNDEGLPEWKPATKETPQRNLVINVDSKMSETFYGGRPLFCVEKLNEKM